MTSIPFVIVRAYRQQFKCSYLKNKKLFLNCLLLSSNLDQIFNALEKEMTFIACVIPKLRTAKDVVIEMFKNPCFRKPFKSQHVKGSDTAEICMTALLTYFSITLTEIALENVCVSNMRNLKTVC